MKKNSPDLPEIEPIPVCGVSRILGLLETLDDHGGREAIGKLARELHIEFGELLAVVRAAEMLGLVNTPGPDVILETSGKHTMELPMNDKKKVLREKIEKLPLFRAIRNLLDRQESRSLAKDVLLEELAIWLPNENPETMFKTIVNWGRYAELFTYDSDQERLAIEPAES